MFLVLKAAGIMSKLLPLDKSLQTLFLKSPSFLKTFFLVSPFFHLVKIQVIENKELSRDHWKYLSSALEGTLCLCLPFLYVISIEFKKSLFINLKLFFFLNYCPFFLFFFLTNDLEILCNSVRCSLRIVNVVSAFMVDDVKTLVIVPNG
ncbi:uncharacterized protein EV154DRAFT_52044 [Mucor mucedo]|uniref:uncharacterized protein n=1 Tax=Mucor mucedo TaxID=29922 RepID=UPI00221FDD39|nr:uncharacterized protein EV154DRAFT_52044 [Mucor mucedo]KAI7879531.1 hypothetical protein EV154DRAFT_52044 [Mucor mucedo]